MTSRFIFVWYSLRFLLNCLKNLMNWLKRYFSSFSLMKAKQKLLYLVVLTSWWTVLPLLATWAHTSMNLIKTWVGRQLFQLIHMYIKPKTCFIFRNAVFCLSTTKEKWNQIESEEDCKVVVLFPCARTDEYSDSQLCYGKKGYGCVV